MKPVINSYYIFFVFILSVMFLKADAAEKKSVIISGDNSKTRLVGKENGEKIFLTEMPNIRIKFGNSELRADKGRSYGKNNEIVEALGNVVLTDKLKGSKINAAKAVFFMDKNIVEFHGRPNMIVKREDDNSVVKIQADMIKYDFEKDTVEADGKVKLRNNDLTINSEKAEFNKNTKTAIFSGDPVITRDEDVFNADEVLYHTEKKLVILDRNAHAKFYSQEKDKETKKIKKERVNAKGDRIERYDTGEKVTVIKGNAVFEREDSISTGDFFEIRGEENSQEITGLNVHINYKRENTEAVGKNFKWYKKDGYSALWDNASMIFKDQKTGKVTSKVFGDYMEYYKDTDELYVSGNVSVIREDGVIKGDIAKYKRPDNKLRVTGNARIEKNNSIVLTQEISINTKSDEYRLHGDIRGRGAH